MTDREEPRAPERLSRRSFLMSAGGVAAGGVLTRGALASEPTEPAAKSASGPETLKGVVEVTLEINGADTKVAVEPRTTLLGALRHRIVSAETGLPLTGTKEVCDRGNCGACTVMLDGRPAYACMQLAIDCVGREITTVEGLGSPGDLSAVQEAFVRHDALMCGFCTSGFVVATTALLDANPQPTRDEIQSGLSGNICRCGTYPHIFDAAETAAAARRGEGGSR